MIAIPLVVAGLLLLLGKVTDGFGHYVATLAPIASFVVAVALFADLLGRPEAQRAVSVPMYTWIKTGSWTIDAGLLIDPLSILFALLVTGVGGLIHVYSIGYMAHDPGRRRFFAYLNLFIAAMLTLVLSDNYLVLFVGWEGVGLASYLLISFWQHKPTAATAGKKAFVVNRVGDLGMTMAIFTMLAMFGSSSFEAVNAGASKMSPFWVTLLGLLLLVGACGKSAQVPLQSWLLDAMEGPTPVSALIHAATMVTAGVYLVVRSHAVYAETSIAALAVAIVGTVTLLAGAWIGTSKDDIKKVLAGSTMSQIGYMMLAAGIGPVAYPFAIFHLLTHGFFKANMFLGAGSVMHGMDDDVNMRHYGGLAKAMRITYWTFLMGYLAIIGTPFFSGFYSKDSIIEAAWEKQPVLGALALLAAGVTAFYMTRLMFMTFWSRKRWQEGVHPHESPAVMWVPLVLLAIPSVIAGMVMNAWIGSWLAPAVGGEVPADVSWLPKITVVGLVTLAAVIAGVLVAYAIFGRKSIPESVPYTRNVFTIAGRHDLYGDAFNEAVFMRPGEALTRGVVALDSGVVDGAVRGSSALTLGLGGGLRRLQNGYVRSYGLTMIIGVIVVGLALVIGRLV
ncbi:MAG TPA: NADH-quinone oxidoreductase subunit L [Propionibacteriaceae bacterium]|nr:NADH-quinone oxidoreductase subunit L [Propionibacteriaceae bacterium]